MGTQKRLTDSTFTPPQTQPPTEHQLHHYSYRELQSNSLPQNTKTITVLHPEQHVHRITEFTDTTAPELAPPIELTDALERKIRTLRQRETTNKPDELYSIAWKQTDFEQKYTTFLECILNSNECTCDTHHTGHSSAPTIASNIISDLSEQPIGLIDLTTHPEQSPRAVLQAYLLTEF